MKLAKIDKKQKKDNSFTIALAGNPNVGKSTVFNNLTGMKQHTGNWPGKTVVVAKGKYNYSGKEYTLVDTPGTYSIMSNSEEEEIARNYICFGNPDVTVIVLDATSLEKNLNLAYQIMEITDKVILCVNLLDEAKKKGIVINLKELEKRLGVPVVGVIARKKKTLTKLMDTIKKVCEKEIMPKPNKIKYKQYIEEYVENAREKMDKMLEESKQDINLSRWITLKILDGDKQILKTIEKNLNINLINNKELIEEAENVLGFYGIKQEEVKNDMISNIIFMSENVYKDVVNIEKKNIQKRKIDKIITSKIFGIPIMLGFLGIILWITIKGANYPSEWLFKIFNNLQEILVDAFEYLHVPIWLKGIVIDGIYKTLTWIIAVMLPPMAIFFPLFTLLEDLGFLPRIAFNLDKFFKKAGSSGKQALTMCMGFGCNSCGVTGCRIIDSPREKLISILTNAFVPCNGRFPFLITISTIFIGGIVASKNASIVSTIAVLCIILIGIFMTILVSKFLSKTILKGESSSFVLELPPYRKPQIGQVLVRSILDRTLFVLGRAIAIALPAGIVIWIFANVYMGESSILTYIANSLNPFAQIIGLDGYILTAFILGIPANEIVLPIILMGYMGSGTLVDLESTTEIAQILIQNGWTLITAINVMIFTLLHFPCTTTLLTIKKETGSIKWSILAFLLPTICGIILCMTTNFIWQLII